MTWQTAAVFATLIIPVQPVSKMPADKIKCCLCGLRKHYDEFSKTSRKEKEPVRHKYLKTMISDADCRVQACKRCVAWTETQEPGVIPAPLETGHVSIEEFGPSYWGGEYRTGEDFFVGDRSHEVGWMDLPSQHRLYLGLLTVNADNRATSWNQVFLRGLIGYSLRNCLHADVGRHADST